MAVLFFVYYVVIPVYKIGSVEEPEVAGFFVFSHIWMMGYFRFNECPAGLGNWLRRVRALRRG